MATTATYNYMWSDFNIELTTQNDGDIEKYSDIDAVKSSIKNIILTFLGQRVLLPTFAENDQNLLFEPMDKETAQEIGESLLEGIRTWDDRVIIDGLDIYPRYDDNRYDCLLRFYIKTSRDVEELSFTLLQG